MKILLVEDDTELTDLLVGVLTNAGFTVDATGNGVDAEFLGSTEEYDAVVLDLGLPQLDGLSVLKSWRSAGQNAPVLILTARSRWSDKLSGFDAGADDYVTKPFNMEEVVVRLKALIRRAAGHAAAIIECGPLRLDTVRGQVFNDGLPLELTTLEFKVLSYLMHHWTRIISSTELLEHVYGVDGDPDSNVINVIIGRIRKKIGGKHITTVRGRGYRLEPLQ